MVTRKSTGDVALSNMVKLLIFDEVHLLHDDRGSVIETLVARTLRQVNNFFCRDLKLPLSKNLIHDLLAYQVLGSCKNQSKCI